MEILRKEKSAADADAIGQTNINTSDNTVQEERGEMGQDGKDKRLESIDEKVSKIAHCSWSKNRQQIFEDIKRAFGGRLPKNEAALHELLFAVGYRAAVRAMLLSSEDLAEE